MKKTKIICTMGPNTNDRELMKKLVENGMDIARFNFSHGDHEEQKSRMDMLKAIREEAGKPIAILLDTKGPEIRTGVIKDDKKVTLVEGQKFTLTTKDVEGDANRVSITYEGLVEDVEIGKKILIDDGLIELEVKNITDTDIICRVINGGELGQKKGVNVPNVPVRLPALTEKDRQDIIFGVEQGVDFIAASFVRSAEGVLEIKALLKECGAPHLPVIAKIENAEGIKNIDEIIRCADGIMVARGDLGVEIPAEEVPYLQKMLTDVANAVYDGTDAVMLSGETAQGKYPLEALQMMVHIIENTEEHLDYETLLGKAQAHRKKGISSAIGYSSVATAANLNAKCIVTPTVSGATARVVSKFRPKAPIIGVSPSALTLRKMQLYRGVYPIKSIQLETTEDICEEAINLVSAKQIVEPGDIVVLTAGIPARSEGMAKEGISNMMRIAVVE